MSIGIVILAAGASSRMERPKLSLEVFGKQLLGHILSEAVKTSADNIIIVTGAHSYSIERTDKKIEIVFNQSWTSGIGSSIKTGLSAFLDKSPQPDAVIFLVADQPFVTSTHIENLIKSYRGTDKLTASHYNGTAGVPALFPQRSFNDILKLKDSQGAKAILEKNSNDLVLIEFPQGGIDIDTPEDYQKFLGATKD